MRCSCTGFHHLLKAQVMRCAGPSRRWSPAEPPDWPGRCPRHKRRASSNCRAALSGTVMATRSWPYTYSQHCSFQARLVPAGIALC